MNNILKGMSYNELKISKHEYSKKILAMLQKIQVIDSKIQKNVIDILTKDYRVHEFLLIEDITPDTKRPTKILRKIEDTKKEIKRSYIQLKMVDNFLRRDKDSVNIYYRMENHKVLILQKIESLEIALQNFITVQKILEILCSIGEIKKASKVNIKELPDSQVTMPEIMRGLDKRLQWIKEAGKIKMRDILK